MLRIMDHDCGTKLALSWYDPQTGQYQVKTLDLPVQVFSKFSLDLLTKYERDAINSSRVPHESL